MRLLDWIYVNRVTAGEVVGVVVVLFWIVLAAIHVELRSIANSMLCLCDKAREHNGRQV